MIKEQAKFSMMMKNYNELVKINHNQDWPDITHSYMVFINVSGSGSGRSNELLNSINYQRPDVGKLYLYAKKLGIRHEKNQKTFIYCSQKIDDV